MRKTPALPNSVLVEENVSPQAWTAAFMAEHATRFADEPTPLLPFRPLWQARQGWQHFVLPTMLASHPHVARISAAPITEVLWPQFPRLWLAEVRKATRALLGAQDGNQQGLVAGLHRAGVFASFIESLALYPERYWHRIAPWINTAELLVADWRYSQLGYLGLARFHKTDRTLFEKFLGTPAKHLAADQIWSDVRRDATLRWAAHFTSAPTSPGGIAIPADVAAVRTAYAAQVLQIAREEASRLQEWQQREAERALEPDANGPSERASWPRRFPASQDDLALPMAKIQRGSAEATTSRATDMLAGDGRYAVKVAGTGHRRPAIHAIVGNRQREMAVWAGACMLESEPDNPHDPNAIKVLLQGVHVGYIAARQTVQIQEELRDIPAHAWCCNAVISGGQETEDRTYDFGIELDLARPLRTAKGSLQPSVMAVPQGSFQVLGTPGAPGAIVRIQCWLPHAAVDNLRQPLDVMTWTNLDWENVSYYLQNIKRAGLGYRVLGIDKANDVFLFGLHPPEVSATLLAPRVVQLEFRVTAPPMNGSI